MGVNSKIILDQVADILVNVNQTCLTSAISSFILDIQNADTVNISNMNVTSTTNARPTKCNPTVDVAKFDFDAMLKERVDTLFAVNAENMERFKTLKIKIRESITVNVASSCIAIAISAMTIRIKDVRNTVTLKNINILQTARSQIRKSLQFVKVKNSSKSLKQFLDLTDPWLKEKDAPPPLLIEAPPTPLPQAKKDCTAIELENTSKLYIYMGIAVGILFLLILICGVVIVREGKQKKI